MPSFARRRSRTIGFDDDEGDEESRPSTPASTAPNDSKRARLSLRQIDDEEEQQSHDGSPLPKVEQSRDVTRSVPIAGLPTSREVHQPGSIIRIKLTNFVTYTSAEFFPGPSLNMVIGPNGTGKSTLVCAICLGLGWGPQYLGRAKDAAEFVKHGCREATIEIELQRKSDGPNATRRNPIITRTIRREGNKSSYTLNGTGISSKAVQSLAQSFNIQIDNLCQFLPQDKVVEFAQMTPIEILQSTQRATSSIEMLAMHEHLKNLRNKQKDLMADDKGGQERLANLRSRQEMQRIEVERMRERAAVQKRLSLLEKSRPIPQYFAAKKKYEDAKVKQKQLADRVKELKRESGPILTKVNAKQQYEKSVGTLKERRQKDVNTAEQLCDNIIREIEKCNDKAAELNHNLEAEKKSLQPKREDLKRVQQRIALFQHQKLNQPEAFDSRATNQEIQDCVVQRRELEVRANEIKGRKDDFSRQRRDRKEKIEELQTRMKGLETQSGQQANKLEQASRDTFKAWKWIEQNRDLFQQHVYGPPMVECSLKNPRMANSIESLLQGSDYKIITVQNQSDFTLLQRKLNKELRLHDVSIRTCDLENLENFRPALSADEMKRFGLDSWAIDEFNGPPTILAMLCIERNLHQCALANRDISQEQHDALANSSLRSYVAGGKCYQFVRRAEYGSAGNIARVRDVRQARVWTNQTVDFGRKAAFEREINENKDEWKTLREEEDNCKTEFDKIQEEYEALESKIKELRQEKDRKQKVLMEWNTLDMKIQQARDREESLRQNIETVKDRLIEIISNHDKCLVEKAEIVIRFASATHSVKEKLQNLLKAEVMHIEAVSDFENLSSRNQHLVDAIKRMVEEEQEAAKIAKVERENAKELGKACRRIQEEGQELEQEGEPGLAGLLQAITQNSMSEEDLDTEITSERARLELTEGGNANAIKEYEERAGSIEKLQSRLSNSKKHQDELKYAIEEIRHQWEPQLDEVVHQISDAFSDSFARIGCAGQVVVYKASSDDPADCIEENGGRENGLDFANWAIHISVKFRENEPLSLLDSHRQSGGERAVSTIFYLMAMQSLSRAPFRVVDEINQGMDPRNERMVHGRMVDIATEDGGSQHFLITPKLLSGLKYRRGMTVLCIVSGENMPPAKRENEQGQMVDGQKVDFKAFINIARQLGLGNRVNNARLDSGVGLTSDSTIQMNRAHSRVAEVEA